MYFIITGVKKIVRFTEEFTCRGSLNPGSSVINNSCGEIWKGQCSKRGEAVSKLFIEKRESYLIWAIYHTSFPEDNVFIRWCLISRFLYNREKLEIKDPRKNKTALIYCVFCFVCLFVCLGNFDTYFIIIAFGKNYADQSRGCYPQGPVEPLSMSIILHFIFN